MMQESFIARRTAGWVFSLKACAGLLLLLIGSDLLQGNLFH
ncbi:hypothetical protein DCCM_3821 [Desulfocucumis palustris]|uniref:Uncharacterized protein n=1 Tax=Desulfocucumis palustris TaxID=1898651 RepID=A0A2L2XL83_9FIRM|nr:hypothetical protein DCCM_3821 [Desulfocucumis palustris]